MIWYKDKTKTPKHLKQWHSGRYIVRWRDEFMGVSVLEGYHALVKTKREGGEIMLDMVWRYKVFRTRRAARKACEDHAAGLDVVAEYRKHKQKKRPSKRVKLINEILESVPVATIPPIVAPKRRGRPPGSRNKK